MTFACLGADPAPQPPRFAMPSGATDTHFHIIGVPPEYPFVDERSYTPPEAPLGALQQMHHVLGIDRAVIVTPSCHGTDNRITLEAIKGYGPGARGIAVVDPDVDPAELERLHTGGIRGLRLNVLFGGGVGLGALTTLADKIAPLGWHLQLLIDVSRDLREILPALRTLPVPVVVDHMGHLPAEGALEDPGFRALLDLVREGVAWAKLSGADRVTASSTDWQAAVPMARALIEAGPERMVWGTDWPHVAKRTDMPKDGALLDLLADYAPDPAQRRAILVDNPARLYGFGPA